MSKPDGAPAARSAERAAVTFGRLRIRAQRAPSGHATPGGPIVARELLRRVDLRDRGRSGDVAGARPLRDAAGDAKDDLAGDSPRLEQSVCESSVLEGELIVRFDP